MIEMEAIGAKVELENHWRVKVNWATHKSHIRRKITGSKSAQPMKLHIDMETLHFSPLRESASAKMLESASAKMLASASESSSAKMLASAHHYSLGVFLASRDDIIITFADLKKATIMFDEIDNFCLVLAFHSDRPYFIVYDSSKMELHKLQQNIKFASDVCDARHSLSEKTTAENFLPTLYDVGDVLRHWMDNCIKREAMLLVVTDLVSHWLRMHKYFHCHWNVPAIDMVAILLDEIRVPSIEIYDFLAICIYEWAGEEELKVFLENFLLKVLRHATDIKYVPELSSLIAYYMYVMCNQSQGLDYHDSFVRRNLGDKTTAANLAMVCAKGLIGLYHNLTLSTPREVAIPSSVLETSTRLRVELETISGLNLFSADPNAPIISLHDNDEEIYFEKTEEIIKYWAGLSRQIGCFRPTDVLRQHCRDMPHGKRRYDFLTALYFHTWHCILNVMGGDFKLVVSRHLCAFPYYERALSEHLFATCLVKLVVQHDLSLPLTPPLCDLLQTTVNSMPAASSS